jgi:LysM repeat protein
LADYNNIADAAGTVVPGTSLTVPCARFDYRAQACACFPKPGSWKCHEVKSGETFKSIAAGADSLSRDEKLLRKINEDLLYGASETEPPAGIHVRLPAIPCTPSVDHICYTVAHQEFPLYNETETLDMIAKKFSISVAAIQSANTDTLGGSTDINLAMQIVIPTPRPAPPLDGLCVENDWWSCYVVQQGDTRHIISGITAVHEQIICEINPASCGILEIGQVFALPKRPQDWKKGYNTGCDATAGKGVWFCWTVPNRSVGPGGWFQYTAEEVLMGVGYAGGGMAWETSGNFTDIAQHLVKYNADILPTSTDPDFPRSDVWFVPGQQVRVPFRSCWPTVNMTCAAMADDTYTRPFLDLDYFSPMISEFNGNGALNLYNLGSCEGGLGPTAAPNCAHYVWNNLPLASLEYNACYGNAGNGTKGVPCLAPGGAGYECPTCAETHGRHWCYKVAFGETLSSISAQYDMQWADVCAYNQIQNCSCLVAEDTFIKMPMPKRN